MRLPESSSAGIGGSATGTSRRDSPHPRRGNSPTAPGVLRERLPLQCLTSLPVYVRYLLPILAPGDDLDIRWELLATLSYTPDPPRHHSGHSPPGLVHTGLVSPQAI